MHLLLNFLLKAMIKYFAFHAATMDHCAVIGIISDKCYVCLSQSASHCHVVLLTITIASF